MQRLGVMAGSAAKLVLDTMSSFYRADMLSPTLKHLIYSHKELMRQGEGLLGRGNRKCPEPPQDTVPAYNAMQLKA